MPHEMNQLHRDAPCGRLRYCCGGRVLSQSPRRVFARMLWSVWLRRVEVALSMKLISTCYSQLPGWRKRSASWRGGPQCSRWHGTRRCAPEVVRCLPGFGAMAPRSSGLLQGTISGDGPALKPLPSPESHFRTSLHLVADRTQRAHCARLPWDRAAGVLRPVTADDVGGTKN
jgi:hypothetical protein